LKFAVTVTLKKDVLDPQGKVVSQTLKNMGMSNLVQVRQGKFFEIDLDEKDTLKAESQVKEMCEKLLANQIIEDFKINKK
jgi:phosphoribosylformylglycinamidine synthase PurS subunit|tara:strand:+ start:207 stop:446 length:240 start_codon:yes stop_codon:yes gene_type:complete